ncbi:cell division protein FtsY [[Haemophilus] ducreyi]|uniref:Signal recognition particle receptor FtsY n=1 Tax=Haemophilus ducreyi TaxID=730 RepID=A0AAC9ENA7_HAEDC|nr:signal recognition particle-docking protein FtsY [[Haemophilus] ducreyi]AKO30882.1 cell division protein FtsY [[Haemophilus] ducreyi]AKO32320.1 cell division protein FtsY [[Haemophilus] ducreyi]AKO33774.1 cell division protein FtsY [[Haemophilus] ducreyi]AKO35222.1 cell division protein FtsY [[Haemophilus] ducreyi]AKO44000.1 cell division protein FtsY [[Haemophilus] ducreyi]
MAEKKKGFLSWLNFRKKEHTKPAESETTITEAHQAPPLATEVVEDNQALPQDTNQIEPLENNVEQIIDQYERSYNLEKLETSAEEKLAKIDEFVAQQAGKIDEFIDHSVEETKKFIQASAEKIEHAFEEEKLQSIAIIDTARQPADHIDLPTIQPDCTSILPDEPRAFTQTTEISKLPSETEIEQAIEITENAITPSISPVITVDNHSEKTSENGFFSRLLKGLIKTKQNIGSNFRQFFRGKKIDDELFEELEERLLMADLGMPTTTKIIQNLTTHATKKQLKDADLLYQQLKIELANVLKPIDKPLEIDPLTKPYVILMVGVNGVGKTTTIGKLAKKFQDEGKSVMLAAGDTFRAAAVEQLQVWGERNNIPVVAQTTGADSASVIFDAMQSAASKGIDILIADTAGRLQNKNHLMDELKKIVRVMKKYNESAPHEIMLTLDAGTGQNAISQAKLFNEATGLTGITLTKLDGTAKGGVIFAIADQFNLPIRFIGVGEKIDDLRPFNAEEFIDALFEYDE